MVASAVLAAAASACTSPTASKPGDPSELIMVLDGAGVPIQGAILIPDEENKNVQPLLAAVDLEARASDARGVIRTELYECLWDSDGCYHFRIHKRGYEDATVIVSEGLFPPVLKIELKPKPSGP